MLVLMSKSESANVRSADTMPQAQGIVPDLARALSFIDKIRDKPFFGRSLRTRGFRVTG
jgi:hypothetical protein